MQHQVLHHEIRVALEARAVRNLNLEDPVLRDDPLGSFAATTSRLLRWRRRTVRLLHPAWLAGWFDVRATLEALQPGDLLALLDDQPAQISYPAQQFNRQSLNLGV